MSNTEAVKTKRLPILQVRGEECRDGSCGCGCGFPFLRRKTDHADENSAHLTEGSARIAIPKQRAGTSPGPPSKRLQ